MKGINLAIRTHNALHVAASKKHPRTLKRRSVSRKRSSRHSHSASRSRTPINLRSRSRHGTKKSRSEPERQVLSPRKSVLEGSALSANHGCSGGIDDLRASALPAGHDAFLAKARREREGWEVWTKSAAPRGDEEW